MGRVGSGKSDPCPTLLSHSSLSEGKRIRHPVFRSIRNSASAINL